MSGNIITVIVSDITLNNDDDKKSLFNAIEPKKIFHRELDIDVNTLSKNFKNYLNNFGDVLSNIPEQIGEYSLQEITLNLALGAKGEVRLIAGVESSINGGISIKLVKKEAG